MKSKAVKSGYKQQNSTGKTKHCGVAMLALVATNWITPLQKGHGSLWSQLALLQHARVIANHCVSWPTLIQEM